MAGKYPSRTSTQNHRPVHLKWNKNVLTQMSWCPLTMLNWPSGLYRNGGVYKPDYAAKKCYSKNADIWDDLTSCKAHHGAMALSRSAETTGIAVHFVTSATDLSPLFLHALTNWCRTMRLLQPTAIVSKRPLLLIPSSLSAVSYSLSGSMNKRGMINLVCQVHKARQV